MLEKHNSDFQIILTQLEQPQETEDLNIFQDVRTKCEEKPENYFQMQLT